MQYFAMQRYGNYKISNKRQGTGRAFHELQSLTDPSSIRCDASIVHNGNLNRSRHAAQAITGLRRNLSKALRNKDLGTATLSSGGPLIRAQNFGKIEHIHQLVQLYQD